MCVAHLCMCQCVHEPNMAVLNVCVCLLLGSLVGAAPNGIRDVNDIESLLSPFQCREGWVPFQGSCYQFVASHDRTWKAAKQACEAEGSHLLSIQSRLEFQFIKGMVEEGVEEEGGILFHELWWTAGRKTEDGSWIWDDDSGNPVSFDNVNWYPGEPNDENGEEDYMDILYMHGKWGMNDAPNRFQLRSICEYDINPAACRPGWESFNGHCYQFVVSSDRTWKAAQQACSSQESHLVSIDTSSEFDFLQGQIKEEVKNSGGVLWHELWWTGGRKVGSSRWVWDMGNGKKSQIDFGHSVNWYPGEPNNEGGNEDYLDILYMDGEWGMNDAPNKFELRSICEYDPNPCQTGWKHHGRSCYKFVVGNSVTRNSASQNCEAEGATLVSINSPEEFNFLQAEIRSAVEELDEDFTRELWWTSGQRRASSNHFVWGDNTDLSSQDAMWYEGEPNNHGGDEDNVNILYASGAWGLNDAPGDFQLRSVCERNL